MTKEFQTKSKGCIGKDGKIVGDDRRFGKGIEGRVME